MTEIMQIEQTCNSENLSAGTAEESSQSPAGPMVLTVGQGSAPILKLVSPVDGGAPQLIKVVPAVVSTTDGAQQSEEKGATEGVVSQRVYSIVQKPQGPQQVTGAPKQGFNNGQQRLHTIGTLPQRIVGPQKVQILSNVVVSNKNLVNIQKPLQAQRQIITPNIQKPLNNNTPKPQTTVGKVLKTVGGFQPQKTIKTLSPQSPQNYAKSGIKTLSPQMNHYNKTIQNSMGKMVPVQRGIKTIAPQRGPPINNNRANVANHQKPNYIGKHASQAHKTPHKPNLAVKRGPAPQKMAPLSPKYPQKGVGNPQTTFNQSLTAQILQNLPTNRNSDTGFSTTKNYPLQSPTEDTLSEDIGEEVKPDFSPNLSYLYQVVMLDHNYGAPPPALSPPVAPPRTIGAHQSPGSVNGALINNRERDANFAAKRRLNSAGHDDDAASTISSEGGAPDDGDEGEETETAPEGEGDEDGITRCICDFDHDDGYMICCDVCSSWQHVDCMGLDRDHIPDKYSCVRCAPRRVDRAHARALQQRKREEFARLGPQPPPLPTSGAPQSTPEAPPARQQDRETKEDSSSDEESDNEKSVSLNNNLPKKRSAPVSAGGRRRSEPARRAPLPPRRPPRRESATSGTSTRRSTLKKREKKQIVKRKLKTRSSVDDSSQDSWLGPNSAGPHTLNSNLMQLRQWIENYEEAVTNHYSPELRARISNMRQNGAQQESKGPHEGGKVAPQTAPDEAKAPKCKIGGQPLTGIKILLAGQSLPAGATVVELRGKYMLGAQHRGSTPGLLTRQHSQRPGPFLFFYRFDSTEVCVDTRTYGNEARFIRRSCRPNAELRHLVEKGALHLYIITTGPVDKNCELTLKHESHDLAAAALGPTNVACACGGSPQTCLLHAEPEEKEEPRKKRGRRATTPPQSAPEEDEDDGALQDTAPPAMSTRRASSNQREKKEEHKDSEPTVKEVKDKKKKLTREERKMEAIMKAFERLEKAEQRKQEVQARQAQRRESDPIPSAAPRPENGDTDPTRRRKKRKGRSRTTSGSQGRRRLRLNSTDSYLTSGGSGEESLQSPPLPRPSEAPTEPEMTSMSSPGQVSTAAGLLLALASGGTAPEGHSSGGSVQSSPGTPLSSACLLVAAAVGPLEPGFKFPKTKKVLMNEWLNKEDSPTNYDPPVNIGGGAPPQKNLQTLVQAASLCDAPKMGQSPSSGNAKKRWLRQAIEECESPPTGPPKKRRLARESLSSEQGFTPPSTPTMGGIGGQNDHDEEFYPQVAEVELPRPSPLFRDSAQLLGTVEKSIRFYEESLGGNRLPPEPIEPQEPSEEDEPIISDPPSPKTSIAVSPPAVSPPYPPEDSPPIVDEPPKVSPPEMSPQIAPEMDNLENMSPIRETTPVPDSPLQESEPPLGTCSPPPPIVSEPEPPLTPPEMPAKEAKQPKPEIITPAKRKLSITEYRKRKQLQLPDRGSSPPPDRPGSPESPPLAASPPLMIGSRRSRSASSSSATSSLSSDEEILIGPSGNSSIGLEGDIGKTERSTVEPQVAVAFNSAPTAVERQRENVERLKKVFGLSVDDETRKNINPIKIMSSPPEVKEISLSVQKRFEAPCSPPEREASPPKAPEKVFSPKFDEPSFIPPFNNPVYPNSTQFTGFSSVIDSALYEGRNPSPPPSELLISNKLLK